LELLIKNAIRDTFFRDTARIKNQFTKEKLLRAHLLWEQGVAGSNPATSTEEKLKTPSVWRGFLLPTHLTCPPKVVPIVKLVFVENEGKTEYDTQTVHT